MKKLLQFGAGNIGRSFIGQLFSMSGYEVVFIDIDSQIIEALNQRHEYIVKILDKTPDELLIKNVRGIYAIETDKIANEIAEADVISTSVGKNVLPGIVPILTEGLNTRYKKFGLFPIDILICENILDGAFFLNRNLRKVFRLIFLLMKWWDLLKPALARWFLL